MLEYKLTPITLNQIVNYILEKWDLFVEQNPLKLSILDLDFEIEKPLFKTGRYESYSQYRSLMQVIDLSLLDLNSYDHSRLIISTAAFYFQVAIMMKIVDRSNLSEDSLLELE